MADTDTSWTVDVYMRADESTLRRRREITDRLESIKSKGGIDRFTVRTWPRQVTVDGPNSDVVAVVERFQEWAADAGIEFGSTFERRDYERSFTDESGELLTLPTVALAVYEGDDLVDAAPHTHGSRLRTVDELLVTLEDRTDHDENRRVVADELS